MKMKKRFLQILAAGAAAICCLICTVIPASAARPHENAKDNCRLYDPDGMFDETDAASLNELIQQTSDAIDMYIAVYVLNASGENMSEYDDETFADDRYDELFNVQYGEESDGLMLLLNMPTHHIYITTCGMGQLYYYNGSVDDRIETMNTNLHSYLRSGDNTGAVTRFCTDAQFYYEKGIPANCFTYNSDTGEFIYSSHGNLVHSDSLPWWYGVNWAFLIPVALGIGGLTALIAFLVIKSSYQLKKSLDATNYISDKETNFYVHDDIFLRTHTTKRYRDPDRGSGGGGGGGSSHMSSGGFSHGGGGSHW